MPNLRAGPWSGQVNRLAGAGGDFTVGVRPMRQEVHHVRAPRGFNGDGVSGNPTLDISTSFAGQTAINTLGALTTSTKAGVALEWLGLGSGRSLRVMDSLASSGARYDARRPITTASSTSQSSLLACRGMITGSFGKASRQF